MKIKEKGLTGNAAKLRKESLAGTGRKGFNAFKEMAEKEKGKGGGKRGKDEKAQPEVFLEFLGARIRVHEEDGGRVEPDDVPRVKGASLRFDGAEGDVSFDEVKVRALLPPASFAVPASIHPPPRAHRMEIIPFRVPGAG